MLNIAEKAPSDFVQIANFRQGIGRDPLKTTAAGAVFLNGCSASASFPRFVYPKLP